MRLPAAYQVLLAICCSTLLSGCTSSGRPQHEGKVPRVAAAPMTSPTTDQLARATNQAYAAGDLVASPSDLVAPGASATVTDAVMPGDPTSVAPGVAQVQYTTAAQPAGVRLSDQSSCGCNSCANAAAAPGCNSCFGIGGCRACKPAAPFGYAMPCGPMCTTCYDPQEYICDGGDYLPLATLRKDDSIAGLQPEDTVVHYTTQAGTIEFEASNRVCLYAPRFLSVRKITGALAGGRAVGLAQMDKPTGPVRVDQPLPGLVITETTELAHADVARRIDAMRERNRGVPIEAVQQPELAADVMAALVGLTIDEILALQDEQRALLDKYLLCAITWELDESVEVVIEDLKAPVLVRDERVDGFTIYESPDGRLQISKMADKADALPGEVVNFAIRVVNVGDAAVGNIVLTDNLTTRLEYVEGSQTATGGAIFDTFENEGQSLRLEWKLTDQLRVGESMTIRFKCRVR